MTAMCCHKDCLRSLARNDEKMIMTRQDGDIKAVVSAMKHHKVHPDVQHDGCRALSYLAVNNENSLVICQEEGIKVVVCAMSNQKISCIGAVA